MSKEGMSKRGEKVEMLGQPSAAGQDRRMSPEPEPESTTRAQLRAENRYLTLKT